MSVFVEKEKPDNWMSLIGVDALSFIASSANRGARIASLKGIMLNQSTFETEMRVDFAIVAESIGERAWSRDQEKREREKRGERECPMCVP